jgi:hypothetical protein
MVDSNERGHSAARPIPSVLNAMLRASDGILELLPIATFICDAKGTILQYNRHAVAVWGGEPAPGQTHEQFRESIRFLELDGTPVARWLPRFWPLVRRSGTSSALSSMPTGPA